MGNYFTTLDNFKNNTYIPLLKFGKKRSKGKYIYKNYKFIKIIKSKNKNKKYDAIFLNINTNKNKKVSFGAAGMSDYTKHKNDERKKRYINRHKKRENWNNLISPGALSRWILWNKKTFKASLSDYKRKFK